ncbi:alpha/beta hydrolase [Microbacterium hatanonis]|uniref:Alpha/beta hydrolase n=1 Tax=Microbacterium hatanonis TaxID=404366 RepID=A0A5C8I022_9MICO|nr:alpha/beta hydrolase [Microbacterium hatanonis]TXK12247.1 alpha/beta hydrolase [Microbacterium hatanonis]
MTRVRSRIAAAVAVLASVVLVASGCSAFTSDSWAPPPTVTPDVSGVSADLLPFYGQEVAWESCAAEEQFDCANVRVPRDWNAPAAGEIEIAVIRHRADSGEPIGSLFTNPGGPGVSGVDTLQQALDVVVGSPLRENYDVIGFDPRGVGASTAVDCYDTADLDQYLYDIPDAPRGSDEWTAELEARDAAFAAACDANSDGLLPFVSTENAARDLDVLRAVTGQTTLDYLGYSWGTALGAAYAQLHPDRVGRMVLDGALDPSIPGAQVGVGQMEGFQRSLDAFLTSCVSYDDCPFRGTLAEASADLDAVFASVDARPLVAVDGRELGADTLMLALLNALYSPASWPYLRVTLTGVQNGDPAPAFTLADAYNERQGGGYVGNSEEAFPAYNCMDYPVAGEAETQAAQAELEQVAPLAAEYFSGPDVCEQWPYPPTGTRGPVSADGAAPILVIGTTSDPATPYQWAVSLADQLQSGVLVTRVGEGHTGYNKGNTCVDDAVVAYLVDGVVPDADIRCE